MTLNLTRTQHPRGAHRAHRSQRVDHRGYPHDYLHSDRSYDESQRDIGGGLFLGAITLIVLMGFIVTGLLF